MAALIRCGIQINRNIGHILKNNVKQMQCLKTKEQLCRNFQRFAASLAESRKEKMMIQVHKKIDYNLGVSSDLFKSVYSSLENMDSVTEHDVGLLLFICNIGPFDAPTEKRLALVDEIWSKLDELGIKPTAKLYNGKLRTYISNKKLFDPLQELMNMKALGINPDKITYGLLVEGFCQKGDIAGAHTVLQAMQAAELPLSVHNFNSFITGHLIAGSYEEATKVLDILRNQGLLPNSDTFLRFAQYYAEKGDFDSVMKYINEAYNLGVPLDQNMLLDLYRLMVISGHSSSAEQMLKFISERGLFNSLSIQKSCQLMAEGFIDAAFQIFMTTPNVEEGKLMSNTGNFLLKAMIINGQSAQEIMNIADRIVEIAPKALSHRNTLLYAYRDGRTDLAMDFLDIMRSKNYQIKPAYPLPAICGFKKQNNKEGVLKAVQMLLDIEINEDKMENLVSCAYPALIEIGMTNDEILSTYKNHEKLLKSTFISYNIVHKGFKAASQNAQNYMLDENVTEYLLNNTNLLKHYFEKEWEDVVSFLEKVQQSKVSQLKKCLVTGEIVRQYLSLHNEELTDKFLSSLIEKKIKLHSRFHNLIIVKNASSNIKKKLFKIIPPEDYGAFIPPVPRLSISFMDQLNELKTTMSQNDVEAMKLKLRELQVVGFKFDKVHLVNIVRKLLQHGDVETALKYFEEIKTKVGNKYSANLPVMFAAEYVKMNNLQAALDMINLAAEAEKETDSFLINSSIRNVLAAAPTAQDASDLHSAILKAKIVPEKELQKVHHAYVKRLSSLDDDNELINRLMKLHESFRVFPALEYVLIRFIEKKDVDRLNRIMDLGISVYGSNYFHHQLAMSFLQCGLANKAAYILQTPGLRLSQKILVDNCQYFIKSKKIDCVSALVEITKNMPVSRSAMLELLIDGYIAVGDLKKAIDSLQLFTEDIIEPPKPLLKRLIAEHKKLNVNLPEVLQAYDTKIKKTTTPKTTPKLKSPLLAQKLEAQDDPHSPETPK
ncbi:leucine-rich PPR motif-containing protein, mitochondrial-like [Physella acuta]|uniref:leucine-rich PPR motif-containing protein, mitochondrial-like n=1 Tax=Physella acuta TaxID=109671 RepID=UPI0027DD15E6|nr:leucine-rich PPR motif-containing protein, mitochondrial-like [Physella acuta]